MAVEIESKTRVEDRVALLTRLNELAGDPIADIVTADAFYDTADRRLLDGDCGLRVRRKLDANTGELVKAVITYKGPRAEGPVKKREEIETAVGSAGGIAALLDRLGYPLAVSYEKRRTSWQLDDCQVELDRVPLLGDFVEIEGPSEESVANAQDRLGVKDGEHFTDSYITMLLAELDRRGISERHIGLEFDADA